MTLSREQRVLLAVFTVATVYRAFWALTVSTSFVPDEYYQSLEPAYNLINAKVVSDSSNTWEWQENYRIRSFVPLLPYLLLFQFKSFLRNHWGIFLPDYLVSKAPRLITGVLISYSDVLLFSILRRISNSNRIACVIFLVHLLSWSATYCLSRTLINSIEAALLIIGIYFWSLEDDSGFRALLGDEKIISDCGSQRNIIETASRKTSTNKHKNIVTMGEEAQMINLNLGASLQAQVVRKHTCMPSFAIAVIAVTVHSRPTALLFWAPLLIFDVLNHASPVWYILNRTVKGLATLLCCILFDSICYEHFTVTPLNFFHINVTHNYAALFYGAKSWHWNFTHNLPVMLGLYTPFLVFGLLFTPQPICAIVLEFSSLLYILLLRCMTAHQEYRFILPCLPFLHIAVGYNVWSILVWCVPSLQEQPGHSLYTVFSFCCSVPVLKKVFNLSSLGTSASATTDMIIESRSTTTTTTTTVTVITTSTKNKKHHTEERSAVKRNAKIIPKGHSDSAPALNAKIEYSKNISVLFKLLSLCLLAGVAVAHFVTALYLATRHQVNGERFT